MLFRFELWEQVLLALYLTKSKNSCCRFSQIEESWKSQLCRCKLHQLVRRFFDSSFVLRIEIGERGWAFIFGWVQNYVRARSNKNFNSAVRFGRALVHAAVWWIGGARHLRFRRNRSSEDLWHEVKSVKPCPTTITPILDSSQFGSLKSYAKDE